MWNWGRQSVAHVMAQSCMTKYNTTGSNIRCYAAISMLHVQLDTFSHTRLCNWKWWYLYLAQRKQNP